MRLLLVLWADTGFPGESIKELVARVLEAWVRNGNSMGGALQQLGIVGPVIRTLPAGYVEAHEVALLTEIDS